MIAIETEAATPQATVEANIRSAILRGIDDIMPAPFNRGTIHVYASGPSAMDEPPKWPCIALNGALGLFDRPGLSPPSYWAAFDPGDAVAPFLKHYMPLATRYLCASKLAPAVFDRLAAAVPPRACFLWHTEEPASLAVFGGDIEKRFTVNEATTISVAIMGLLAKCGWTDIHYHGWDGCYAADGRDHAAPQPHSQDDRRTIDLMGHFGVARTFDTSDRWITELLDAMSAFKYIPTNVKITVHGDGMMAFYLNPIFNGTATPRPLEELTEMTSPEPAVFDPRDVIERHTTTRPDTINQDCGMDVYEAVATVNTVAAVQEAYEMGLKAGREGLDATISDAISK